jgi:hypothetical protein
VPKKTCQVTTLTLSREVTAISGRRDSNGPPERVLKRWNASSHEEVEGVRHALVGYGRQPEKREEHGVEGRGEHHEGNASPPARASAVAPPTDQRVIDGLDQAGDREQQSEDKDGDPRCYVGIGGRGVEVDEPEVL